MQTTRFTRGFDYYRIKIPLEEIPAGKLGYEVSVVLKLEFYYFFFAFAAATRFRITVIKTNATEAINTAEIVSSIAA